MLELPNPSIENVAGGDSRDKDHQIILLNEKAVVICAEAIWFNTS